MNRSAAGAREPLDLSGAPRRPFNPAAITALRIGWRNLWRNGRRTALTAGGIAFAVLLVVSSMCLQFGSYAAMEETATSLLTGHLQIANARYLDDRKLEDAIPSASDLIRRVRANPKVTAAAPRVEAFVLASVDQRSFGAQVLGIDPEAERRVVRLHRRLVRGRFLQTADEAVLGDALARNLGVGVGDDVVLLGSARHGGVAAMVVTVSGLVRSGIDELDRGLLLVRIDAMRAAFDLADDAHTVVIRTADLDRVQQTADELARDLPETWRPDGGRAVPLTVRSWHQIMPELRQAVEVDRLSGALFYWIILVLVAFSVVNTFIMTVFERTREFGMLLAIGMRPGRILLMLQCEAFCLWAVGAGAGLGLALLLNAWLASYGVPLGDAMEQFAEQLYMPSRIYPAFTLEALTMAPLVMLVGAQIAALLPGLRVRRMRPVDALRVAA